jgi:hypothetical protein
VPVNMSMVISDHAHVIMLNLRIPLDSDPVAERLATAYDKGDVDSIFAALRLGVRKLTNALAELRVEYVPARDCRNVNPECNSASSN